MKSKIAALGRLPETTAWPRGAIAAARDDIAGESVHPLSNRPFASECD
jgi:hypothetical protein